MSQDLFNPYVFAGLYAFGMVGFTAILCMIMSHLPKDKE